MGEAQEPWKRLFFLLLNNQQPDGNLPNMWIQFKRENAEKPGCIKSAVDCIRDRLSENERKAWEKLCSKVPDDEANLLRQMKDCPQLGDHFWQMLFAAIRDRGSAPIGSDKTVPILEAGQTKQMTMQDIEEKFSAENPDILKSCKSVPDHMIHEDLIDAHLNVKSLEALLQDSYDLRFSEARATMAGDNPKWDADQLDKQAAAQAKKETKESRDAQLLQHRVAMKAEEEVQRSIQRAMAKFKIPVHIFRGVNTYDQVGRLLKSFDIPMSRLKRFKPGETEKHSLECEHDVGAMALLPTGPLVSFTQVGFLSLANSHQN